MSSKSAIQLLKFFVYNPTLSKKEGEEEKNLMYYYPQDVPLDNKIKDVGLCEALVKFSRTFAADAPCESLHTQKTRQLFLEAEENYWLILVISIPTAQKVKDSQVYIEYHEDDVHDTVYMAVLKQAYQMQAVMARSTRWWQRPAWIHLKIRPESILSQRYLQTCVDRCDVLDVFNGMQFLPLDKNGYLRTQCFLNQTEASFPQVKYTAFLYNESLVWSDCSRVDIRILYKYLTTSLSLLHGSELQAGTCSPRNQARTSPTILGKFITGPPNLADTTNLGKVPRIFVNVDGKKSEECHLVVYRALSASVCLMVEGSYQLNFDFYRLLDQFLGPQLTVLASDIGEQYGKRLSAPATLATSTSYFQHMNLAEKSSLHARQRPHRGPRATRGRQANCRCETDLAMSGDDCELVVKGPGDCWVVARKKSDQRELYYVNQKCSNLIEIAEEVKKLCASHFNNIFFLD
ncbi:PREDICTED: LOW QUALITY PROTEIN: vacuolar fusion protein CCZ1 homolog [Priapulus caudatus]|uniref:LOW QUALITY PROTEIN: vacuolar fusion protein CCZ1 homolog n=1 Tax=Priapulus caudatus TaxID=37621 RepID=A0ABM1EVZ9_PRICU|nr:PREDICTED: LOW QUALITY PROTEIN: vacuolar fusion protein CCZ1 homolog [Priapulus caudatus]